MKKTSLQNKAFTYLKYLCCEIPTRRVGTQGNTEANNYLISIFSSFGFEIERQYFDCIDWTHGNVSLTMNGEQFEIMAGPFTVGCDVQAPLAIAATVEELETADIRNKILLLHGSLTREQLMPKNFPFYNPDEHQQIIQLLETKEPYAVLSATGRNPESAGAVYPFPMIEDGDFNIPSAYMSEEEGHKMASYVGKTAHLVIKSERQPSKGFNLVARKGNPNQRVVISAHIDSKDNTPGALDNAASVVVLLLLSELLEQYDRNLGVELVPFNGEDHYSAEGEKTYLKSISGTLNDISLNINMDALGSRKGKTVYSFYECPEELKTIIKNTFSSQPGLAEGEPWYQSDHMIFALNNVPALAITSENFQEILSELAHTPKDSLDKVDIDKLVVSAEILRELVIALSGR